MADLVDEVGREQNVVALAMRPRAGVLRDGRLVTDWAAGLVAVVWRYAGVADRTIVGVQPVGRTQKRPWKTKVRRRRCRPQAEF